MLKIYLDWNIISYLKLDEYKDLRNYITQVKDFFIFPYSRAHIQDLYQSKFPDNIDKYEKDLETLTDICQTHLLNYEDCIDAPYPYECSPSQFIEREQLALQAYASGFDSVNFTELIKSMMDKSSFDALHQTLQTIPLTSPVVKPVNGVHILNMWDALCFALDNLSSLLKDKKLEVELYKSICKVEGENMIQKMQMKSTSDIFTYLNKICLSRTGKHLTDSILETLEKINGKNSYNYFLAEYTTLAFTGYSRDKKRNILNIMTDAIHSFYAMRCDVLVTKDEGMRKKAEAEFKRFNSPTRIITIEELHSFLEEELHHEYNYDYIQQEIIPKYSKGEYRGEGKYAYKNVPSPILGLFNNCIKIPFAPDALALKVNLIPNGYVYYTELNRFFNLIKDCLSEEQEKQFQRDVVKKFLTKDRAIILSIRMLFSIKDWLIEFLADPESEIPLPMVIIRKTKSINNSSFQS